MFCAKMRDVLEDKNLPLDFSEYENYNFKVKDDYLKNHLLTATSGSNTNNWWN